MQTKYTTEEARQIWLAFLREPGRKKHRRELENVENPEARCCLGHACYAFGAERSAGVLPGEGYSRHVTYDGEKYVLPKWIAENLNITRDGELIKSLEVDGIEVCNLEEINDNTDKTPAEIADFIEEQFRADNLEPYNMG